MSRKSVLSLFTGAGGLDLGLEAAGFDTRLCVEMDPYARETLRQNRQSWTLAEPGDIHAVEPEELLEQADLRRGEVVLLAGGPPCQPFSQSAYWAHRGRTARLQDPRAATLQAYLDVVDAAQPAVILLENVKGLMFNGKREGMDLLLSGLKQINERRRTRYTPTIFTLNAASYGVPQFRERIFLVASVDGKAFVPPDATHGPGAAEPWRTAWDAIGDLDTSIWSDELNPSGKWAGLLPSIPEGQNYLWHTPRNTAAGALPLFGWRTKFWSFLLKLAKSQPSWTLQANPGPATGPFHWRNRLLSPIEVARLQTFPSDYTLVGQRRIVQRQLGNAVPSALGELLGLEIRRQFFGESVRRRLRLTPQQRSDCPAAESVTPVPRRYHALRGTHRDHPGAGLGPGVLRPDGSRWAR